MRETSRVAGWVAVVLSMGCGGGGSSTPPPTGNPVGPTPSPTAPSAIISIVGDRGAQSFTPNPASVVQGRTVAWTNTDTVTHRIMTNDGSLDTGNIAPGATSQALALMTDGTNYHCTLHPGMIGSVNGSGGAPPPCTGIYC